MFGVSMMKKKKINLVLQVHIKLIKRDSKERYNVMNGFCF